MVRALTRVALATTIALGVLAALVAQARAQPGAQVSQQAPDPQAILRAANAAAVANDWPTVARDVDPLVYLQQSPPLSTADLAEANRLSGLAAFFLQRLPAADARFLDYLRLDPDAALDPTLYPPEVVSHFEEVRARHAAEMRVRRHRNPRQWLFAPVPIVSQLQNGERTKAWILGGAIVALAATNVTTYVLLRHYCNDAGSTCDADGTNHTRAARDLQTVNIAAGIGLIATVAWSIYDGVAGYRRVTREQALELQPFASPTTNGVVFGVGARF